MIPLPAVNACTALVLEKYTLPVVGLPLSAMFAVKTFDIFSAVTAPLARSSVTTMPSPSSNHSVNPSDPSLARDAICSYLFFFSSSISCFRSLMASISSGMILSYLTALKPLSLSTTTSGSTFSIS